MAVQETATHAGGHIAICSSPILHNQKELKEWIDYHLDVGIGTFIMHVPDVSAICFDSRLGIANPASLVTYLRHAAAWFKGRVAYVNYLVNRFRKDQRMPRLSFDFVVIFLSNVQSCRIWLCSQAGFLVSTQQCFNIILKEYSLFMLRGLRTESCSACPAAHSNSLNAVNAKVTCKVAASTRDPQQVERGRCGGRESRGRNYVST